MDLSRMLLDTVDRAVARQGPTVLFGEVAVASPLTVTLAGDTSAVPVSRLASYTPTVTDTVVLLHVGSRWVAIGALA